MTQTATEQAPARRCASGVPETLKKRSDFVRLSKGVRKTSQSFVLQACLAGSDSPRVGFTITKKTGNAPERNRMRRRLRAAVRGLAVVAGQDAALLDYVIVARRPLLTQPFPLLTSSLAEAMGAVSGRFLSSHTKSGA